MDIQNLSIVELHNKLKNKEISVSQLIDQTYKNLAANLDSNFLITLFDNPANKKLDELFDEKNLLSGIPYVTKDNFWAKDKLTTAGSKILSNFYPTDDATITKKLYQAKTVLLGKTAMDELGMGGTGLFSFNGIVRSPFDEERIAGGSSSGSAYAVAKGLVSFATGTDTGDSIRKPASFNGIVGFKPTYGSLSRYGVIPYAPSLDHVGFFTKTVEDMAVVCDATFGYDKKDFTSIDNPHKFYENINNINSKIKFGYIKNIHKYIKGNLKKEYENIFQKIKAEGFEIKELDFKKELLDAIPAVYMMISFSEAVSTHSNLDGINFGLRVENEGDNYIDIIKKTRASGFGRNVKKRFVIGSYQLRKENQELILTKSKKVRTLIIEELNKLYEQVDVLILPPTLDVVPKISDVMGTDIEDRIEDDEVFLQDLLILANFNGMPSITIPFIKENNLPIGINLCAKPKMDLLALQAAKYLENLINKEDK